jgi:uncharacterized SAM-binding protein YcdF (DUF218 family)
MKARRSGRSGVRGKSVKRRRRLAVGAAGAVFAVLLALLAATIVLLVRPRDSAARRADAIVVLGPGVNGERLREGLRLKRLGRAPRLVISRARDTGWEAGRRLCGSRHPEALCFRADPYTTRGEAHAVADLARQRGWRSLLVVTSKYHVTRVRLLYGRCIHARVDVVGADPHAAVGEWIRLVVHEWAGLAYALSIAREC